METKVLRLGIDFDNTLVCYDPLFHKLATERQLIPLDTPVSKGAVRDALRANDHEETWIAMQGEVYGARITEAQPFDGVKDFLKACVDADVQVSIVSHKTLHPFRGPQYDLHAAARRWLEYHGICHPEQPTSPAVYLELTKEEKCTRIGSLGCDYFIDDLPEFLLLPFFPEAVGKLLFDPAGLYGDTPLTRFDSWAMLQTWLQEHLHNISENHDEYLAGGESPYFG